MKTEGKIPIVIGITGHRNLLDEEIPGLRDAVREELRKIREVCPASPLLLLSSLAAGADQLCAEIGLEEGFELSVPLPMPLEEYEKDFRGSDLQQLRAMIKRARDVFVVNGIEPYQDGREYCYRQAGIYIAEHCHVLLALWDGELPVKNACGTAAVVSFKLYRTYHIADASNLHPQEGNVIWIHASRSDNNMQKQCTVDNSSGNPLIPKIIKYGEAAYTKILIDTDAFNRDVDFQKALLERENVGNSVSSILSLVYDVSDRLSIKNAEKYRRIIFAISVAAMAVTIAFLLYDERELYWMILICGLMIASLFVINHIAKRIRCHQKYIEYRVLAEGLRVQGYLLQSGMTAEVWDMIPWAWQVNTPWIRDALSVLVIGAVQQEKRSISDIWVRDQKEYHRKAYNRTEKKLKANNRIITFALFASILAYGAALFFEVYYGGLFSRKALLPVEELESVRTLLKILLGGLSAATLFVGNYYGKLSLDETLNDHARMLSLYEMAEDQIQREGETEEFLYKLACEELSENSNWYAYQSINKPDISL